MVASKVAWKVGMLVDWTVVYWVCQRAVLMVVLWVAYLAVKTADSRAY